MLRDRFNINCTEPFLDDDMPITYQVAFKVIGGEDSLTWIYVGPRTTMNRAAFLPAGKVDNDYRVDIFLRAKDGIGAFVDVQMEVKVSKNRVNS